MSRDVVLDVDTGADDALALLYALRCADLRVRAVTCVAGNVGLDRVVRNTTAVVGALRSRVPVAAGTGRPLLTERREFTRVHGDDGMVGVVPPGEPCSLEGGHAVELLRETILGAPDPVTVVALAPLTNLALLARTYPEVVPRVAELRLMGGSIGPGNVTPVAEFNVWSDPEAAAVVLAAGWPVSMYGMDVFYRPALDSSGVAALRGSADVAGRLAGEILHNLAVNGPSGRAYLGDAGLVASLGVDAVTWTELPVTVDTRPGLTRGMTVADRRGPDHEIDAREAWSPVRVATEVDAAALVSRYTQVLVRH
ncbi:nucleoside hydrolase [Georgenia halophila]|uniref:Nucleoside hydrolase n=1 Tax=Georgenia halophila TaxID=620889 RepID=A0ABP8L9L6_9MICO